jgi:hypothetical protein
MCVQVALDLIHRHSPGSTRRLTHGADKGYDAEESVREPFPKSCRWLRTFGCERGLICKAFVFTYWVSSEQEGT